MQTTQAKHTPGPWAVGDEERNNIVGPGGQVASVGPFASGGASRGDFDTMTANARLIAAAPELLDFVRAVEAMAVRQIDGLPANHEARRALTNTRDEARRLIANATT